MILSPDTPESEDLKNQNFLDLYQLSMDLYGLIHARFILTQKGLQMMKDKFTKNVFGTCPRILCNRQPVLPIGMSEELSIARVKVYCPKCKDVYIPRMRFVDIDGAYFGCSFPHIFLQTFPDFIPKEKPVLFVPKIYGFVVFGKKGSKYKGKYIYKKVIEDPNEMIPWIRSFGERAKVISSGTALTEKTIAEDWERAAKKYESLS